MVMEVFSRLMGSSFAAGLIKYHPKTEDLDISHLMFADEVMVFFDGSSYSLNGIADTMELFASWSGLQMNCDTTLLFNAGLNREEAEEVSAVGFTIGTLPIRYLGLPLMSRKLRISEFTPLMDKMIKKFNSWAVSTLSFAGRFQLIKSVIYGLVNFWSSTFILPKDCIKKMESLCACFLWSGNVDKSVGANVAWADLCYPKQEGGLGLRRMKIWNVTLCLKLVWLLFSGSESLWVAWHKFHHLRGKSFWSLNATSSDSWNWRSLLSLRNFAEQFLECKLGNGLHASFWFDCWTPLGPLIKLFGEDGPRDLRIPIHSNVAAVLNSQNWSLNSSRSSQPATLQDHLQRISFNAASQDIDTYSSVINGTKYHHFNTAKTWESLRPRTSVKEWFSSVWFKGATPKHAFNMWVAQLNRLPTRARLIAVFL